MISNIRVYADNVAVVVILVAFFAPSAVKLMKSANPRRS